MRRAGIIFILIPVLLLPSCLIVKREFRRGFYLDFNRSVTTRGKEIPPPPKEICRKTYVALPDPIYTAHEKPDSCITAEPEKTIQPTPSPRIVLRLPHPDIRILKRPQSVPIDPFSTATFITALILSFIVPPLAAFLAFGKGRIFRTDLWLYIGGVVLFITSRLMLMAGAFNFTLALMIIAGFVMLGASVLYTLYHLLRAFFKRPAEP